MNAIKEKLVLEQKRAPAVDRPTGIHKRYVAAEGGSSPQKPKRHRRAKRRPPPVARPSKPPVNFGGRDGHDKQDRHGSKRNFKLKDRLKLARNAVKEDKHNRRKFDSTLGYPGEGPPPSGLEYTKDCEYGNSCIIAGHYHREARPKTGAAKRLEEQKKKRKRKPTRAILCTHASGSTCPDGDEHCHCKNQSLDSDSTRALVISMQAQDDAKSSERDLSEGPHRPDEDNPPLIRQPQHVHTFVPKPNPNILSDTGESEFIPSAPMWSPDDDDSSSEETNVFEPPPKPLMRVRFDTSGIVGPIPLTGKTVPSLTGGAEVTSGKEPAFIFQRDKNLNRAAAIVTETKTVFLEGSGSGTPWWWTVLGHLPGVRFDDACISNSPAPFVSTENIAAKASTRKKARFAFLRPGRGFNLGYCCSCVQLEQGASLVDRYSMSRDVVIFTELYRAFQLSPSLARRMVVAADGKMMNSIVAACRAIYAGHDYFPFWIEHPEGQRIMDNTVLFYVNQRAASGTYQNLGVTDKSKPDFRSVGLSPMSPSRDPFSASGR